MIQGINIYDPYCLQTQADITSQFLLVMQLHIIIVTESKFTPFDKVTDLSISHFYPYLTIYVFTGYKFIMGTLCK